ncbi:MAG: NADH-quinone oxidoreductase subunit N [Actinomycetota bacterium]|nr:NADH-quinone oxidoreductase subunit N [Actinomycetota bacterium]
MPFNPPHVELAGIAPELALSIAALVLLVLDAVLGERLRGRHLPILTTVGFGIAIGFAIAGWRSEAEIQLSGMVANDGFAAFVKVTLCTFGLLSVWLAREYLQREKIEEPEFYALVMFAVAGMMLMAAATDLIVMFLALETFSLALYVLVGFRRRALASQESAMKYFLLGSFSSAFFLLGIALAYGATGSTSFYGNGDAEGLATFLAATPVGGVGLLVLATGLLTIGLGFKVAAVPFHMWTPDAYQGAPSPVTGFMAAASKLAGFAALLRLLDATLFSLRSDWRPLVIAIAVATMIVGSVVAVVQEDLKRLLAYSSIAHAGFVLTGVIATSDRGVSGALFYLATYGLTVLGAFAVVAVLAGRDEKRVRLVDFRGLFYDHPMLAAALTLFLLSLAGVPITSGFVAKLVVFGAAIETGYAWLAVIGVLTSAIAAFFYLRVMVVMYMQERQGAAPETQLGPLATGVVAITAIATIVFGLFWGPLIELAEQATFVAVPP